MPSYVHFYFIHTEHIAQQNKQVLSLIMQIKNVPIYIALYRHFGLVGSSPIAPETGAQSQMESYQRLKKWYLMPLCFTTQHYKERKG